MKKFTALSIIVLASTLFYGSAVFADSPLLGNYGSTKVVKVSASRRPAPRTARRSTTPRVSHSPRSTRQTIDSYDRAESIRLNNQNNQAVAAQKAAKAAAAKKKAAADAAARKKAAAQKAANDAENRRLMSKNNQAVAAQKEADLKRAADAKKAAAAKAAAAKKLAEENAQENQRLMSKNNQAVVAQKAADTAAKKKAAAEKAANDSENKRLMSQNARAVAAQKAADAAAKAANDAENKRLMSKNAQAVAAMTPAQRAAMNKQIADQKAVDAEAKKKKADLEAEIAAENRRLLSQNDNAVAAQKAAALANAQTWLKTHSDSYGGRDQIYANQEAQRMAAYDGMYGVGAYAKLTDSEHKVLMGQLNATVAADQEKAKSDAAAKANANSNPISRTVQSVAQQAPQALLDVAVAPGGTFALALVDKKYAQTQATLFDTARGLLSVPAYVAASTLGTMAGGGGTEGFYSPTVIASNYIQAWNAVGPGHGNNLAQIQIDGNGPLSSWAKSSPGTYNFAAKMVTDPVQVYGLVTGGAALGKGASTVFSSFMESVQSGTGSNLWTSLASDEGSVSADMLNPTKWFESSGSGAAQAAGPTSAAPEGVLTRSSAGNFFGGDEVSFSQLNQDLAVHPYIEGANGEIYHTSDWAQYIAEIQSSANSGIYEEEMIGNLPETGGLREAVMRAANSESIRAVNAVPDSAPVEITTVDTAAPGSMGNLPKTANHSTFHIDLGETTNAHLFEADGELLVDQVRSFKTIEGTQDTYSGEELAKKVETIFSKAKNGTYDASGIAKLPRTGGLRSAVIEIADGQVAKATSGVAEARVVPVTQTPLAEPNQQSLKFVDEWVDVGYGKQELWRVYENGISQFIKSGL